MSSRRFPPDSPPEGPRHHGPRVTIDPRAPRSPSDLVREIVIGEWEGHIYRTRGGRYWWTLRSPHDPAVAPHPDGSGAVVEGVSPKLYNTEHGAIAALWRDYWKRPGVRV